MSKFSQFSYAALADPEPEDDFVAGLVHQMAHSMLDDNDEEEAAAAAAAAAAEEEEFNHPGSEDHPKMWGSLHDFTSSAPPERRSGSWGSSNTSPSPGVSPPTPLQQFGYETQGSGDAWELLHMAAQEVMRLKMGRALASSSSSSSSPPISASTTLNREELRHSPGSFRHSSEIPAAPYNSNTNKACPTAFGQQEWKQRSTPRPHSCYQACSNPGIPAAYASRRTSRSYQHLQQQQQPRASNPSRAAHPGSYNSNNNSSSSRSSYWASAAVAAAAAQAPNSSGMRAVFLRGPSSTSNGTGVFLPQAAGAGSNRDQNRRPSCSTVLLPTRIVEVLNLNVDQLKCQGSHQHQQQHLQQGHSAASTEANNRVFQHGVRRDDEYLSAQLSKSYAACSPTRWRPAAEHALPTEWTY